jgi:hypothetical protein
MNPADLWLKTKISASNSSWIQPVDSLSKLKNPTFFNTHETEPILEFSHLG